jgi:hypothetical protein
MDWKKEAEISLSSVRIYFRLEDLCRHPAGWLDDADRLLGRQAGSRHLLKLIKFRLFWQNFLVFFSTGQQVFLKQSAHIQKFAI